MAGEFTTENLRIILNTDDGPDVFFVSRLSGAEGISRLFDFDLELLSAEKKVDMAKMLGQSVTLQIMTMSEERVFLNGIVKRMRQTGEEPDYAAYRMEIVPSLWLLSIGRNSRIFQFKTVQDIIHEVIDNSGAKVKVDDRLKGSYPQREYCVQYQESDFSFISRLMEQYGIFYYFTHKDGEHKIVLCDAKGHHDACPVESEFEMEPATGREEDKDYVTSFEVEHSICPGVHTATDYNFTTPSTDLKVSVEGKDRGEIFEYPGEYDVRGDGEKLAEMRMEEQEWPRHTAAGTGECRAFRSGHKFSLANHFRSDFDGDYVLIEIAHQASQAGELGTESAGSAEFNYSVDYTVVPADVQYRTPRLTPKPGIFGTQPAVVVGPSGEEIYSDKYGRVKVQFFWDRYGKSNENSSCWVRRAYGVAGKTWGQIFVPRIGQEVLVGFLEGDPDRPIIVGGVYNEEQMPPYSLPDDQTKSTVKSRSSKGGGPPNFNEIRFEDKSGEEEVYIHAEKDHNQVTENDRSESVGHDRSLSVGNDKSEAIGNNKSIEVAVDHSESIGSNKTLSVGSNHDETIGANKTLSVGSNHTESVGSNMTITVGSNLTETVAINYAETVGVAMELTVGAAMVETVGAAKTQTVGVNKSESIGSDKSVNVGKNKSETIGGSKTVQVKKDYTESVDGNHNEQVKKDYGLKAKKIVIEAEDELTIKVGKAIVNMKKNGDIGIEGKKISLKGSGDIVMKAKKILQN